MTQALSIFICVFVASGFAISLSVTAYRLVQSLQGDDGGSSHQGASPIIRSGEGE